MAARFNSILAALLISGPAGAQTIIECGATSGWEYFEPPNGGWSEGRISSGSIALVASGDELDLVITDAMGVITARSQGADVLLLDATDTTATVLVNYIGGSKEMYTFDFARHRVAWTQHKYGVLFDKIHAFVGDCE